MKKQIKEICEQLLTILPKTVVITEQEESVCMEFPFQTGRHASDVQIMIKDNFVIINSQKEYTFPIDERKRAVFNERMKEEYQGYQIFSEEQILRVTKRFLYSKTDEVLETVTIFLDSLIKSISDFEKTCLELTDKSENTLYRETEEKSNTTEIVEETIGKSEQYLSEFLKYQLYYCTDVFSHMAAEYKAEVQIDEAMQFFIKKFKDCRLKVSMDKASGDISVDVSGKCSETNSCLMGAFIKEEHPELLMEYKKPFYHVKGFTSPDPALPELARSCVETVLEVYRRAVDNIEQVIPEKDNLEVVAEMQKLVEKQVEELNEKASQLHKQEEDFQRKEERLQQKVQELSNEKRILQEQMSQKEAAYQEKLRGLEKREQVIKEQEESWGAERAKYISNLRGLTAEMVNIQNKIGCSSSVEEGEEEKKLKKKVESLTLARAAIEKNYELQIRKLKEDNDDLNSQLSLKDEALNQMKEELELKVEQMFAKEREEYESTIQSLRKAADITGHEINVDSFVNYLNEKRTFDSVKKQPGPTQELVVIRTERFEIHVVFGKLLFVDVAKELKRCREKDLALLNTANPAVKFFMRQGKNGNEAVARQYFSKMIANKELEEMIMELTENFK